ncbi:TauD/TfdA family dioxygenase [Yinghuangia sp. ASG 101]|uniref:TauD/TfdA dioxygenase family protein n=1 Tax=Yinghuangia sp. ASG 101 TaxID=2896848 RepID=UPI001E5DCEA2|nr:TauD/TfdA family dioxygenase [Yinghuangia sp. ASG 101]UGQ12753.1 TauD/TfdA family dioxygenase [Yinghuangia sp. ASG 101]
MAITFTPVSPEIGGEASGLTGSDLVTPQAAADVRAALDRYGVLILREVNISDADLVTLSRLLGSVVVPPRGGTDDHPEVQKISLDPAKSELATYQQGTFYWHMDGANDAIPQFATLLVARQVSDEGGDTEFANMYAAYAALPEEEREELARRRVVHSLAATQILVYPNPTEKQREAWTRVPSREHPMVWTRGNGRRSLLAGATADHVVGLPEDESRALLDRLLEWSTQPRFTLRHHWTPGDLVIWDNTGMLHRALPYQPTSPRLMHRTTLVGEEAVA